jgi:hypothetical protein
MPSRTTSPKPKGKKPCPWGSSRAKEMLLDDIKAGIWKLGDPPSAVWLSCPEFQVYKQSTFGNNFRNLCRWLDKEQARAKADAAAVANDRQLHPCPTITCRGYPFWDASPAAKLLQFDIEYGKADLLKPAELRNTRDEYLVFPANVFAKHVEQELRKRIEGEWWKEYWLKKKLEKQGLL